MTGKPIKVPGPDHPISVTPNPLRVVVTSGGRVVADSLASLTLQESSYPPVLYIPRADVDMALLARSAHTSYCPYKGEAAYFSLTTDAARGTDAVWTYEAPHQAVAAIKDHVAFYPDRVEKIEQRAV